METPSPELIERCRAVATSTWSDVLDGLDASGTIQGLTLRSGAGAVAGPALTVTETVERLGTFPVDAFDVGRFIDAITPAVMLLVDMAGEAISTFGGLAAQAAVARGAAGVAIDGACRDVSDIRATGLWLASRHVTPVSGKRRVRVAGGCNADVRPPRHRRQSQSSLSRRPPADVPSIVSTHIDLHMSQRRAVRIAFVALVAMAVVGSSTRLSGQSAKSGNPIFPGWYADPEAHVFDGQYWIYPTYSAPYDQQTFMDAFSSKDLVTWEKHPRVLEIANVTWAKRAVWAPSVIEKAGWYYIFFGANDIQNDSTLGGIGVARSKSPAGPFTDLIGKPLIDKFHNGAQPIDQMVFKDYDGTYYIVYGGWRHCNVARLSDDFTHLAPFADGTMFKEITPQGYVEGAFMLLKDNKYYFMWSEGGWTGPNYAVAYAVGSSPFGPFERVAKILQQDSTVATGAGHHSVLHAPGSDKWYIVYHRRPLGEVDRNHRVVSIDELHFDERGFIRPVKITKDGVAADPIRR